MWFNKYSVEDIIIIQTDLILLLRRRKTVPLVKISSENEDNITPKVNGILLFKISAHGGIFDKNSIPRDNEIMYGIPYNIIPNIMPIRTCFVFNLENDKPQKPNPFFLFQFPKIHADRKKRN